MAQSSRRRGEAPDTPRAQAGDGSSGSSGGAGAAARRVGCAHVNRVLPAVGIVAGLLHAVVVPLTLVAPDLETTPIYAAAGTTFAAWALGTGIAGTRTATRARATGTAGAGLAWTGTRRHLEEPERSLARPEHRGARLLTDGR